MELHRNHLRLIFSKVLKLSILVLLGFGVVAGIEAQVVQFEFIEAEGFKNGDIAHHPVWMSNTHTNSVDTSGTGVVKLDPDSQWVNSFCNIGLSPFNSQLTVSAEFTFIEASAAGKNDIISLTASDIVPSAPVALRTAFRRYGNVYSLSLASEDGSLYFPTTFSKSAIGLDGTVGDRSDVLSLSMTLFRGDDSADWTLKTVLSNITQSAEVLNYSKAEVETSEAFYRAPYYYFGISSSQQGAITGTSNREVERFKMERIILGSDGRDDAALSPSPTYPSSASTNESLPGAWTNAWETGDHDATTNPPFRPLPEWPQVENISLIKIPATLKTLELMGDQLRRGMEALPTLTDSLQVEAYGYHSGYLTALDRMPDKARWTLEFTFDPYITPEKIVLVPAVDHRFRQEGSYGFPKRLRVLSVLPDGSVRLVKEWMSDDCPDPGRFPLVIDVPPPGTRSIQIEVFRGQQEDNREFFALDEMFGVKDGTDRICHQVIASSEYKSLPYWGKQFLTDRMTSLGLPLDDKTDDQLHPAQSDFSVAFDVPPPTNSCVVELDLGENRQLGYITLFPAQSPGGIMIPGYGFPQDILVEIVEEKSSGDRGITRRVPWQWHNIRPGNNVIHLSGANLSGRWIRLHVDYFPLHNGRRTFAMGEFHVHDQGMTYPLETIRLEGFPAEAQSETHLMRDGTAGGHPVLFLLDWLYKIEHRNQLSNSLDELTALQHVLQMRWKHFWVISGLSAGIFLLLAAVIFAVFSMIQRRRYANRLRLQISSDLHDDVGSKVAAISLASTYVEKNAEAPLVRKRGARIQSIAADMHQALRDVLWLTDTRTDSLDQLVQKLVECARVSVASEQLSLKTSPIRSIAARPLEVHVKRDLLLFLKEALNNATSHSGATRIDVEIRLQGRKLCLKIEDNGQGFNTEEAGSSDSGHHGLRTMRERSKRLHGQFNLSSTPGSGTIIELQVAV